MARTTRREEPHAAVRRASRDGRANRTGMPARGPAPAPAQRSEARAAPSGRAARRSRRKQLALRPPPRAASRPAGLAAAGARAGFARLRGARPARGSESLRSRSTSAFVRRRLLPGSRPRRPSGPNATRSSSTTRWPTASTIRRTWRLRPSRIVSSSTPGAGWRACGRSGPPVLQLDPLPERLQRPRRQSRRLDPRPVDLLDPVARMREPVGQLAVVREQDQAGGVGIEAPDRVEAARRAHQLDHGGPAVRVAGRRHHAGRLVQRMDLVRLGRDLAPIDRHPARLVDISCRIRNDLAVNRYATLRHDALGGAPRGDAGVREELGEPHAPQRTRRWSPRVGGAAPAYGSGKGVAIRGVRPIYGRIGALDGTTPPQCPPSGAAREAARRRAGRRGAASARATPPTANAASGGRPAPCPRTSRRLRVRAPRRTRSLRPRRARSRRWRPAGPPGSTPRGDRVHHQVRQLGGLGRPAVRHQDGEFVAAEARQDVALAQPGAQHGGDRGEHAVARSVAVAVVHLLEAVEVDHEQRAVHAVAAAVHDVAVQLLLEAAPVVEPGQGVVVGDVAQAAPPPRRARRPTRATRSRRCRSRPHA